MTKVYDARLATRITTSVDTRLRQLALVSRRRISHVLDDVLDAALPTTDDLTARFTRLAATGREPEPQHPPASAGLAQSARPAPAATGPARTRAGSGR